MKKLALAVSIMMVLPGCAAIQQAHVDNLAQQQNILNRVDKTQCSYPSSELYERQIFMDYIQEYQYYGGDYNVLNQHISQRVSQCNQERIDAQQAQQAEVNRLAAIEAAKTPAQRKAENDARIAAEKKKQEWSAMKTQRQCEITFKAYYEGFQMALYKLDMNLSEIARNPQYYSSEESWHNAMLSVKAQKEHYKRDIMEPQLKGAASCLKK